VGGAFEKKRSAISVQRSAKKLMAESEKLIAK
jgi:hypothetical protein